MTSRHARHRTLAMFCLVVALGLLATACGDDTNESSSTVPPGAGGENGQGDAVATPAGDDPDSEFCRTALAWQVHELTPFDDNDPAALEAYMADYAAFTVDEAAQAPAEIHDAANVTADAVASQLIPTFERYGYDVSRIQNEATPDEQAFLNEPPADVQDAQAATHQYEALVCAAGPPAAAEGTTYTGPADSAYCDASRHLDAATSDLIDNAVDPADVEALFTSDDADQWLTTQAEQAPDDIADAAAALTDFTRNQQMAVLQAYDYDIRALLLQGSPEERAAFQYTDSSIRDQYAQVEAYDEQVCGLEPPA